MPEVTTEQMVIDATDPEAARLLIEKIRGETNVDKALEMFKAVYAPKKAFDSKKFLTGFYTVLAALGSIATGLAIVPGPVGAYAGVAGGVIAGIIGAVVILMQGKQDVTKAQNAPLAIAEMKK